MKSLVESAYAQGRNVYIVTYTDGTAKQKATLLFKTAQDAIEFVAVVTGVPTSK